MRLSPFKEFTVQWHIIDACEMNCRHCYIEKPKNKFFVNDENFQLIFNRYLNFLNFYKIKGRIYFTGGDPLLHDSLLKFLKISNDNNIKVAIMGNYHRLTLEYIKLLKRRKILFYQLSLDGLKNKHELNRGKGTFNETLAKINLLEENGIQVIVNMTVTKQNISDVLPLMKILSKTKVSRFDFVRVTPLGESIKEKSKLIPPLIFKKLLMDVLREEKKIKKYNHKIQIGKKDNLWKLLYYEHDKLNIDLNDIAYGCGMGYRHLTILSNGDVLLCRKILKKIGNVIKDDLIKIYERNKDIRNILLKNLIKSCRSCELVSVCRGCPSIAYSIHHNFKNKDPQCWRNEIKCY